MKKTALYYDKRIVLAHGAKNSQVFLMNEAPGPCEAYYQTPLIGAQGGNIYRALRKADIKWAQEFKEFSWPILIQERYKYPNSKHHVFELRNAFLNIRARYITCTNSYNFWPHSGPNTLDFVAPNVSDVLSSRNLDRIKNEISTSHRVILICGVYAWLACNGTNLEKPASYEGKKLSVLELQHINQRLSSSFTSGWYLGHTRRWNCDVQKISSILKKIAIAAKW